MGEEKLAKVEAGVAEADRGNTEVRDDEGVENAFVGGTIPGTGIANPEVTVGKGVAALLLPMTVLAEGARGKLLKFVMLFGSPGKGTVLAMGVVTIGKEDGTADAVVGNVPAIPNTPNELEPGNVPGGDADTGGSGAIEVLGAAVVGVSVEPNKPVPTE
jgi:hypothetical protein